MNKYFYFSLQNIKLCKNVMSRGRGDNGEDISAGVVIIITLT